MNISKWCVLVRAIFIVLIGAVLSACGSSGGDSGGGSNPLNSTTVPQISLAASQLQVAEITGAQVQINLTVSLDQAADRDVIVDYQAFSDTATLGEDFVNLQGRLTFSAGQVEKNITLTILDDNIREAIETLSVHLSNPSYGELVNHQLSIAIEDNDPLPQLTIVDAAVVEGGAAAGQLSFSILLNGVSSEAVSVDYFSEDITAIAGLDYQAVNGSLTFQPGETEKVIVVAILGEGLVEANENFTVTLANPVAAEIVNTSATGLIIDDDIYPTLSIASVAAPEGLDGQSSLVFQAVIDPEPLEVVTVQYRTEDGSALAGEDYVAQTGSLTFAIGQTQQTLQIDILGDAVIEQDEQFILQLSNPNNVILGATEIVATIVNDDQQGVSGLTGRPNNSGCIAGAKFDGDTSVTLVDTFSELADFSLPTSMVREPGSDGRWFVVELAGMIRVFDPDNATHSEVFLDISSQVEIYHEGGLLGMAFHPDYPNTPTLYISYTAMSSDPQLDFHSVISRIDIDNLAQPSQFSESVVIKIKQDFGNHNGGHIGFGPDGYLYIGLGDGGDAGDPLNRAQDTHYLLGSMLRLDVTDAAVSYPDNPYIIPAENPFAENPRCDVAENAQDCPEIYAWGLRNPWRWSFDSITGDLWLGDVGQDDWEEVNRIELGGNYGWRCREGFDVFNGQGCGDQLTDPLLAVSSSEANSITGGYVYRGSSIPELVGGYVFADYVTGTIWAMRQGSETGQGYVKDVLAQTNQAIVSFAQDHNGDLYVVDLTGGRVFQLSANDSEAVAGEPVADLLSNTGCVNMQQPEQLVSGVIPYAVNAALWTDGATKQRGLALPDNEQLTIDEQQDWLLPEGSVLLKHFRIDGKLIETRLLMHHLGGDWAGYTYHWNYEQTEAVRIDSGKTLDLDGQSYPIPSQQDCLRCHTAAAGFSLGLETAQQNGSLLYPSTGLVANQLTTLDHIGVLSLASANAPQLLPVLDDWADASAPLAQRARAYLHSNCSNCHRPGGPAPTSLDLRYDTPLVDMAACDMTPLSGSLGLADARIIAPGDSQRSTLLERMQRLDATRMPPLGSTVVHLDGVALIADWIDSLAGCP